MPTTEELILELRGAKCRCGKKKTPRQTFCGGCYFALNRPLRQSLYRLVGEGYEEAYEEAVKVLKAKGRIDAG